MYKSTNNLKLNTRIIINFEIQLKPLFFLNIDCFNDEKNH